VDYSKKEGKAWAREKLVGQWTTMVTPFTSNDEVDEAGLRRNIDHVIKLGTSGMGFSWNMGEFWSLTTEERMRLMEFVPGAVRGRCRLAFQTTTNCLRDAVAMSRRAEELGYDLVILGPPFIMTRKEEQVIDFVSRVAAQVSIGIAFYNSPQFGIVMSAKGLTRLADIENVIAIKEASFNMGLSIDTHLEAGRKVVVSTPDEEIFFFEPFYGFHQQVMFANTSDWRFDTEARPRYVEFVGRATQGDLARAKDLYREIWPMKEVSRKWWSIVSARTGGSLPVAMVKHWGELMGMAGGGVRPPLMDLTPDERAGMTKDLSRLGLIRG